MTPLWFTVRGASHAVAVGWLLLLPAAAVTATLAAPALGPAGAVVGVLAVGWVLARGVPSPAACLRRYHLDDAEVTAFGPGYRVRRVPWAEIHTVTQDGHALYMRGPGLNAVLPLPSLFEGDVWFSVLERVVPAMAAELWARLEDGVIRLAPDTDPPTGQLLWWAWIPALAACLALDVSMLPLLAGLAIAERVVAFTLRQRRTVTIHPGGMTFREGRGVFVPWQRAAVTATPTGLCVGTEDRPPGLLSIRVPNFWAAAAVIQLRAQVGPECPSEVRFRLRLADGGLAVVGEFEASS